MFLTRLFIVVPFYCFKNCLVINPPCKPLLIVVLLVVMLVLSYIIITILEWVNVFDLKTNAILALLVLIGFMINLSVYLFNR